MKFTFRASPNYNKPQSTKSIMNDLNIALLCVVAFSALFNFVLYGNEYGMKVIMIVATAVIVAYITEAAWALITKKDLKEHLKSSFPLATPLIFALICPIGTPLYAIGISTFFAVFFGKLMFGGFGHNIFNPAAVGRAVIFAAFSSKAVTYLGDVVSGATPTTYMANALGWVVESPVLAQRFLEKFPLSNMFFGFYQGAIGETSAFLILALGIMLAIKKVIDWRIPVFYIGTVFVLSLGVALLNGTGMWYPVFSILTGGVMFGAVFMLTDPVTNPTHPTGRIIYAIGAASLTVLIRVKANLPEGVLYSILLMNMLTPLIDSVLLGNQITKLKANFIKVVCVFAVGLGSVLLAASVVTPKDPRVYMYGSTVDILQWRANIISQKTNGSNVTYTVKTDGFAAINNERGEMNIFDITVDEVAKKITKVEVVSLADTPAIAQKINNETFLNSLTGSVTNKIGAVEVLEDVISGATNSAKSAVRAVREINNLYMNETSVEKTEEGYTVTVIYDGYYTAFGLKHDGETESKKNTVNFFFNNDRGLVGWKKVEWGDSGGMDIKFKNMVLVPLFEAEAKYDQVFNDDVISGATFSGFASSTALKSAMLALEDFK